MRIATAVARYSSPFPPISGDPLEQWLVHEAVMAHYFEQIAKAGREQQRREDARREAAELLARHKAGH